MFNFEQAIAEWKKGLMVEGISESAVLDELEGHLREEAGTKMQSGLDARRAFESAIQEIGRPDMIKNEFKKVGGAGRVAEWLMIGVCAAFVALILLLGGATGVLCFTSTADRVMAAVAMVSSVSVAFCWRYAVPFLPVIANAWKRTAAGLACIAMGIVAGSLFCNWVLPHFERGEDRMVPAIGFWMIFLFAVFACPGVGLCLSQKDRERLGMGRS